MKMFPPFMDLPQPTKQKIHNFNPLLRGNAMNPYELEKFDSEILDPSVLLAFLKKVRRTQPLYDLDELIDDFSASIGEDLNPQVRPSHTGAKIDPAMVPPALETQPQLSWYSNENATSARKLDRLVQPDAFDGYCTSGNQKSQIDVFLKAFGVEKERRDQERMLRVGLTKAPDESSYQLPWLDYSSAETQSALEKSEWLSTAETSTNIPELDEHDLNRVAELFEDHLPATEVEYLCILLSGAESKQLIALTEILKNLAILLSQRLELTNEFPEKSSLIKRKLTRIVGAITKMVESELLTVYDSHLDEILKSLCRRLRSELEAIVPVDRVITGDKEIQHNKAHKKYPVPVHQLAVQDSDKESYYDAYRRLTNFKM